MIPLIVNEYLQTSWSRESTYCLRCAAVEVCVPDSLGADDKKLPSVPILADLLGSGGLLLLYPTGVKDGAPPLFPVALEPCTCMPPPPLLLG